MSNDDNRDPQLEKSPGGPFNYFMTRKTAPKLESRMRPP